MLDLTLLRRDPARVRRTAERRGGDASFVEDVSELDAQLRAARTASEQFKAEKNALTASISHASDRGAESAPAAARHRRARRTHRRSRRERAGTRSAHRRAARRRSELARGCRAGRRGRSGQRRRARVRSAARTVLCDEAALRTRRSARHRRFRTRDEAFRKPLLRVARRGRAAVARDRRIFFSRAPPSAVISRSRRRISLRATRCGRRDNSRDLPMRCFATWTASCGSWIPTAEVPLTALHRDEILTADVLPLQYTAYSPMFPKRSGGRG